MSAYFLFNVHKIHDSDKAADYRGRVFATVENFGGTYRILGGEVEKIERDWDLGILVLIEFPDREQATAWYDSDLYRPLKQQRLQAMDASAILIDGFDHQKTLVGNASGLTRPMPGQATGV